MKKNLILGIHGMRNKPDLDTLTKWWRAAIDEGLLRLGHRQFQYTLKMIYWADIFYDAPLDPSNRDKKHPLFLDHPYIYGGKVDKRYGDEFIIRPLLDSLDKAFGRTFYTKGKISLDFITDKYLKQVANDLLTYINESSEKKRNNVYHTAIWRTRYLLWRSRFAKILVLGHSMGSLVAYDALIGRKNPKIHSLVTLGSPLGQPLILNHIFKQIGRSPLEGSQPRVPQCVQNRWVNVADLRDRVTLNYMLHDDFRPNTSGVAVEDFLIQNDFVYKKTRNYHRVYGYLRSEPCAKAIAAFLDI